MTLAELAAARRTTKRAAVTLVRRHGWRRQRDNQGQVIALVPLTWSTVQAGLPGARQPHGDAHNVPAGEPTAATIAAIREAHEGEVAALGEQAHTAEQARAAAQALADQTVALLSEAVARADRAEAVIAEERERAGRLSAQVEALSAEVMRADAAKRDKERAEADRDAERARADALQGRIEALQEQRSGMDVTEAIRQAEAMVHSFREAQAGEVNALKAERHRLATQIDGFATRADQAEGRTDSLRARVDVLQRERDTARAEAAQAADELRRAEDARKGRGLVERLRAAWRGG
jgi:chromosome segregation ATPase